MNALTASSQFGSLSTKFAGQPVENDLSSGIQGGFGHIGYKGKVWSIRYRGEETQLMRDDGDGPRNSIEVVILKANKHVGKIFYEQGFVEGSNAAPDCYSNDGVRPETGSIKPQHTSCLTCPKNAWGSRVTPAGKQGKACQDSKRMAVVPLGDIQNDVYGGPMLLRVPAGSLKDLKTYADRLHASGLPYYAVATRIAFDPNEAYPKFVFTGIRVLTDVEADQVIALQNDPRIATVLADHDTTAPAQIAAPAPIQFEQPPQTPSAAVQTAAPVNQEAAAPAPTPAKVAAPPTVPAQDTPAPSAFEKSLDDQLAALLPPA